MTKFRPTNKAEGKLFDLMTEKGWDVTHRGFPDLACYKDGRLVLVEVKPNRSQRLKRHQLRLMRKLSTLGVECYRWSPDIGFESVMLFEELPPKSPLKQPAPQSAKPP